MRGGAGDDVLEWNDGDGSDVATGGDGADLVRVNGSVTQGDAFEVAPNGQGIRFQRTNLVPVHDRPRHRAHRDERAGR